MTKQYCDRCGIESEELHQEIIDVAKLKWGLRRRYSAREIDLCPVCRRELDRAQSKVDAYRMYLNNDFIGQKNAKGSRIELIDENVKLKMRNEILTEELTSARGEIERLNDLLSSLVERSEKNDNM